MELLQRKKKNNAFIIDSKMSNLSKKKKKPQEVSRFLSTLKLKKRLVKL